MVKQSKAKNGWKGKSCATERLAWQEPEGRELEGPGCGDGGWVERRDLGR